MSVDWFVVVTIFLFEGRRIVNNQQRKQKKRKKCRFGEYYWRWKSDWFDSTSELWYIKDAPALQRIPGVTETFLLIPTSQIATNKMWKLALELYLHRRRVAQPIYIKYYLWGRSTPRVQIRFWAPLPGNGSQSTSQHCRLGLTHYGACLMTDNTSSRSKVANSFSHSD